MKGVFVVGAGPAGMFAARQIALAGYETFIFNRDIRPGGLAQYGIYPLKIKMKTGLQKQFAQTLALPNVHYIGHVQIGAAYDLSLAELEALRPAAIVIASGAQGAKTLGLPGEDLKGVYAAKDFVYNYNELESHVPKDFSSRHKIAVVGVGNVAIDIARWLLLDKPAKHTESVVIIARRGPYEIKFDKKEIEYVEPHLSREQLVAELERIKERCAQCNQDASPEKIISMHFPHLAVPDFAPVPPSLSFRFLSSPKAFIPDANGRVAKMEVSENNLVLNADGSTSARVSGASSTIDVDTVLFAIGDRHDPQIGLPMGPDGYSTRPLDEGTSDPSFEVWDPSSGGTHPGRFVVGWARKASTGLAGLARHDGELGAKKALEFLKGVGDSGTLGEAEIRGILAERGLRTVDKEDLALLARAEQRKGQIAMPNSFHYREVEPIFNAIDEERKLAVRAQDASGVTAD